MNRSCPLALAAFAALAAVIGGPVAARAQSGVELEPKAVELLNAVSDRLAAAHTLSFVAEETFETVEPRVVHRHESDVTLQRPDKLRAIVSRDERRSELYCNGKTMMTYSPGDQTLVIAKAPATINGCLNEDDDAAAIDVALVDLVFADSYRHLTAGLKSARYLGSQVVDGTDAAIVVFSRGSVALQMWVGTADQLPRLIQALGVDETRPVRRRVVLSNWLVDMPVDPDVFTSLNPATAQSINSAEPRPVGTSGISTPTPLQPAQQNRRLWIHSYAAKYWGAPGAGPGDASDITYAPGQEMPYRAAGYFQSADGYGLHPSGNYSASAPVISEYAAQCDDCGEWTTAGTPVPGQSIGAGLNETDASFDIAFTTSGWSTALVAPPDTQPRGTYVPGQIVTTLPAGCAAPYQHGPAFYLCGSTWFSGVYGPDGAYYFRVISIP